MPGISRIRKVYSALVVALQPDDDQSPNELSRTIVPVAVIENLAPTIPGTTVAVGWFSAGYLTNQLASTVHADTGALAAGTYRFRVHVHHQGANAGSVRVELQHRDGANATTLHAQRMQAAQTTTTFVIQNTDAAVPLEGVIALAVNERLRVLNIDATGAAESLQVSIFVWQA